jgi:predicted dehydrogenase
MKQNLAVQYDIQMPAIPRPIALIGAGGIVKDGHLPAYKKAGWQVFGIFDPIREKAGRLAREFAIPHVFESLESMLAAAPQEVIYDIAVPASAVLNVLEAIPEAATLLIQKPMGENLAEAQAILALCRAKRFRAAVNFQMRFIPAVVVAKQLIDSGALGELHDIEIKMNIYHPWHLWEFLFKIPRMEMLYHSIHYMDLMRYFFGNPKKIYAKTLKHPKMMQLASTRSLIILEYDEIIKSHINTNHGHDFGLKHQESFIKFEGTKGAIKTTLGMNIDYPQGVADTFEYVILQEGIEPEWQAVDLQATWFPDAFMGSMANLMCFAEGTAAVLVNAVEEAFQTMELVEAAYQSSNGGGTLVAYASQGAGAPVPS